MTTMSMLLTSHDTCIKPREAMIQKLSAEIIVQSLLGTIPRLISRPRRPIALVKTKPHRLPLCRTLGVLSRANFRGIEESLIALHANQGFGPACQLCIVARARGQGKSRPRRERLVWTFTEDSWHEPRELSGLHRTTTLMLPPPASAIYRSSMRTS